MAFKVADRVKETTTTTGTGTLNLAGAVTGFQTFVAGVATGNTCPYTILDANGTAWEVGIGTVTDATPDTLARTTFLASSTGSAISLSAGTHTVFCGWPAAYGLGSAFAQQAVTPGGRLTLESGIPVSTSDQSSKTTVYYTPYIHNVISLWDGAKWVPTVFAETSLALGTITSGKPYDVFGYLSSGALALEMLVWTNDSTRATAVTLQDGRYCKSGDKTRLLLGTFYTTATTTTEDSLAKRFVWNMYNRVRRIAYGSSAASHTYTTATIREWNGGTSVTRAQMFIGLVDEIVDIGGWAVVSRGDAGQFGWNYLGLNSTTTAVSDIDSNAPGSSEAPASTRYGAFTMSSKQTPALGLNYATVLQFGVTGVTYSECRITIGART